MSAIELGKRDWVKLDLMMAAETDPNDKEVIKKLEEISGNQHKKNLKQCTHEESPIGLGMGLVPPKKKAKSRSGKNSKEKHEVLGNSEEPSSSAIEEISLIGKIETDQNEKDMGDAQGLEKSNLGVESNSHVNKASNYKEFDSSSNNIKEVHENSKEEDVNSQLNSSAHDKTSLNGELEMDQNEDVEKIPNIKTTHLAYSNYRFVNRRRSGSSISISRKNYFELRKGKSIQYVNCRSGSPITIRLVTSVDKQKEESNPQVQFNTSNAGNSEPLVKGQSEENDAMECSFDHEKDVKEIKLKKGEKHSKHFKASDIEMDGLCFNSDPLIKEEQSTKMEARKRMKKTGYKARIAHKKQNSSSTSIHPFVVCRYQEARKRKADGQQRGLE
ncbi:putative serine/threonine-protein kinase roco11 [Bienertia sinuspersici]